MAPCYFAAFSLCFICSKVIVSYNHEVLPMTRKYCFPPIYWRLLPQFFMDKSIINRGKPCFSNVIV
ncbi:hypothetical protein AS658_16345 [Serratia marcescens]|nr:hypothetical protein AM681_16505 [Serratia marcescens]AVU41219.1 hypothetical protein AS658_16345 [Serratia marcescens]